MFFSLLSEGSLIDACKEVETSVESGSFKYFRTQFQFVTGNQVSVELRDRTGKSKISRDNALCTQQLYTAKYVHVAESQAHQAGKIHSLKKVCRVSGRVHERLNLLTNYNVWLCIANFSHCKIDGKSVFSFNPGISHLYASRTNKNPGPLDSASVKNEDNTSPKAVSVEVDNSKVM